MTDFKLFQKHFREYQKKFGLTGYKVYFRNEPIEGGFADITVELSNMVATVRLDSSPSDKHIEQSAKNEALHLLLVRLEHNGRYRFVSENEINESVEELVFKLEDLIK